LCFRATMLSSPFAFGGTVTPDSTFDESMDCSPVHQSPFEGTLEELRVMWNRLDQRYYEVGCFVNRQRKLYLEDMNEIRHGGRAYYSLGGEDRERFGRTFALLNRKSQEIFIVCCKRCVNESRLLRSSDIQSMLHEARGKRDFASWDDLQNRPPKRHRGPYSIPC